jgi:hypothetical protein
LIFLTDASKSNNSGFEFRGRCKFARGPEALRNYWTANTGLIPRRPGPEAKRNPARQSLLLYLCVWRFGEQDLFLFTTDFPLCKCNSKSKPGILKSQRVKNKDRDIPRYQSVLVSTANQPHVCVSLQPLRYGFVQKKSLYTVTHWVKTIPGKCCIYVVAITLSYSVQYTD